MLYLSNPFIIYLHTWKNLHSNLENRKDGEGNRLAKMNLSGVKSVFWLLLLFRFFWLYRIVWAQEKSAKQLTISV